MRIGGLYYPIGTVDERFFFPRRTKDGTRKNVSKLLPRGGRKTDCGTDVDTHPPPIWWAYKENCTPKKKDFLGDNYDDVQDVRGELKIVKNRRFDGNGVGSDHFVKSLSRNSALRKARKTRKPMNKFKINGDWTIRLGQRIWFSLKKTWIDIKIMNIALGTYVFVRASREGSSTTPRYWSRTWGNWLKVCNPTTGKRPTNACHTTGRHKMSSSPNNFWRFHSA